jgi:hypothetical protein
MMRLAFPGQYVGHFACAIKFDGWGACCSDSRKTEYFHHDQYLVNSCPTGQALYAGRNVLQYVQDFFYHLYQRKRNDKLRKAGTRSQTKPSSLRLCLNGSDQVPVVKPCLFRSSCKCERGKLRRYKSIINF